MSRPRLTGVGAGTSLVSGSLSWEYVASNKDLARRVVVFLEDRRVLTQDPNRPEEDYDDCRLSANDIRHWLTLEIMNVSQGGVLEESLKRMRAACTAFVTAAGKDASAFKRDQRYFIACLQGFRDAMGRELGWLARDFKVTLGNRLQDIVPPPDPRPFVSPPVDR